MNFYHLLILSIIPFILFIKITKLRRNIPHMTGMTIAMALGMSVGITVGMIAGLDDPDHILTVTVIGTLVGLGVGSLTGIPISLIAVLDGLLSGIMGGMMGAMLGVMITPDKAATALKIIIIFYLAVMAIIIMTLSHSSGLVKNGAQMLLTIAAFVLVFYTFSVSNLSVIQGRAITSDHQMSNMKMESSMDQKSKKIIIDADEFHFSPHDISVKKGNPITIVLANIGMVEHDLEIVGATSQTFKVINTTGSIHHHRSSDIHVHSAPGQKETITFIPEESGTYTFICTMPGHKEAGMIGKILVN